MQALGVTVRVRGVLPGREPGLVGYEPPGRSREPMEMILLHVEVDGQSKGDGTVDAGTRIPQKPWIQKLKWMLTRESCPSSSGCKLEATI